MRTLEYNHRWGWLNALLNARPFCLDTDSVRTFLTFAWGMGTAERPNFRNLRLTLGRTVRVWRTLAPYECFSPPEYMVRSWVDQSEFYNGVVFLALRLPFGVSFMARTRVRIFRLSLGWPPNGRFTLGLRIQTDASSAAGVHGPNFGQARGFEDGTK